MPRIARRTPEYRRTMAVIGAAGLANFALVYYVQPLLPELAAAFDASPGSSGLALSATTLGMIAGLLVLVPFAERVGRVAAMAFSLGFTGALGILSALSPTWEVFLVARLIMGAALAILPAVALAYLRDRVTDGAHLHANAVYIASTAVGGALGRFAPLPLDSIGGWQLPTVVFGGVSVGAAVAVALWLPPDGRERHHVGLGDVLQSTVSSYRDARLVVVCAIGFVNTAVFVAVYNAVAFRLGADPFHLGDAEAFVYLAYAVCILSPGVFGIVAARVGRAWVTLGGLGLTAAAVGILVPDTVPTVFLGLAVLTFAYMGTHSILSGWAVQRAAELGWNTAAASSAYLVAFYFGSTVAGAIATQLWVAAGWPAITVLGFALAAVGVVLAGGMLARRR